MRLLRELGLLARFGDIGALRELLVAHAGTLEGPLGVPAVEVHAFTVLPDAELAPAVTRMLRHRRQRALQDRRNGLRDLALAGIRRLVSEAVWRGGEWVHLDPALLLGPVLSDPTCKYLAFCLGDRLLPVERCRLLALRKLAPVLPGLSATVDRAWLRFRWRDGRGGLDLRSPDPSWSDREHVLQIVLTPPEPLVTQGMSTEVRASRPAPSTSWLADALAELDLHP